ncbi:hypothetical protein H5410_048566, partial [Solanum commersonii]
KNTSIDSYGTSIGTYKRFKPHILMVLAQIAYTFLYFITEASFSHGMNPHVYITYRHIVAGLAMLPFAYFLEREDKAKINYSFAVGNICTLSTGSEFDTEHVLCELELHFSDSSCLDGQHYSCLNICTSSYSQRNGKNHRNFGFLGWGYEHDIIQRTCYEKLRTSSHLHPQANGVIHENWLKGSILTAASCITWSIRYIMQTCMNYAVGTNYCFGRDLHITHTSLHWNFQAYTLKRYPAQISLTTWMSFVGAAQSAFYTVIVQHKQTAWTMGFNIDFWSTLYGGIVISGLVVYIQLWCTEQKGPVFVTVFNPLSTDY